MADCTCLAGYAAAVYTANNVKLLFCVCKNKRLVNDELKSVKAEIIVYISGSMPLTASSIAKSLFSFIRVPYLTSLRLPM